MICIRQYQYVATASGAILMISSGMFIAWPSPTIPQLISEKSPLPMSIYEATWLANIGQIGNILGSFLGTYLMDKMGRKEILMWTSPFLTLSWLLLTINSYWLWIISRLLGGFIFGVIYLVLPIYLGEISHCSIRGFVSTLMPFSEQIGCFFVNFLGTTYSISTTALISALMPLPQLLITIITPESPYFFVLKDKMDKARTSLEKLDQTEDIDDKLGSIKLSCNKIKPEFVIALKQRVNLKPLIILSAITIFSNFSGIAIILYYIVILLQQADIEDPKSILLFNYLLGTIVNLASAHLVDRLGRKPLLIFTFFGCGISLIALSVYFFFKEVYELDLSNLKAIPIISILSYSIFLGFGSGVFTSVLIGEYFAPNFKNIASTINIIFTALCSVAVTSYYNMISDFIGIWYGLLTFGVCSLFGAVFVVNNVFETKGKTLEEIQKMFEGSSELNLTSKKRSIDL